MKFLKVVILFLALSSAVHSQTPAREYYPQQNAWYMYFGTHPLSAKWGLHSEVQWRRSGAVARPQQLLLRTGINYSLSTHATLTLGYCFVETYPYGDLPAKSTFPEHRIWEQFQTKTSIGKAEIVYRLRLEQRMVNVPVLENGIFAPGDPVYSNRFRVLTRFSMPFSGHSIKDKSLYFSLYDEVMVNFGKNIALNLMDQNRAYAAIGYKIPRAGRLELGYLNQLIIKGNGWQIENNHTLQFGLFSSYWPWQK